MEENKQFKLYSISKTNIQLVETSLEEINTQKNGELSGECVTEIQLGTRMAIKSSREVEGYLKTVISIIPKDSVDNHPKVIIEVIYKGLFISVEDSYQQQLESWVDVQIVPQLLPYTRTLISNLSGLMGIETITLPTIDILETIKVNENTQNENGVDDFE